MTSLWLDRPETIPDDPLPDGADFDDIVIGAGLTGLTTALLLARAGRRVAVLEARTVGALTTGNTTAKVSLLQGTKLSRMLGYQSREVVAAYVEGNLEGQQWLLRFCADHQIPYQSRDAVTYAATPEQVGALDGELAAAKAVGLAAHRVDDLDVPFPNYGGVVLPEQAQLDPMDVLAEMAAQLRSHGGSLHQGRRVVSASRTGRPSVSLEDGSRVHADHIVVATGSPILDRGLYFAKLEPLRSYALAFEAAESTPQAMYLSAGSPSRSIRDAPRGDGRTLLLVGGSEHGVGRVSSEAGHVDELRDWVAEFFPGAVESHAWSAQDYRSHDSHPYIGALPRGRGRFHVATGFDKWGMATAVMAARSISGAILGSRPEWQATLGRRVTRPSGLAHGVLINAKVGVAAVGSLVAAESAAEPTRPVEGAGAVGRRKMVPTGVSTVDGRTCAVLAICTHAGGVLTWNDNDRSWDCPLHGSRFSPDGTVIEGPATRRLRALSARAPSSDGGAAPPALG
ncbi:FAD-dependent oxidoreductase [Aeromicrobium sp. P5_D10]